MARVAAGGWTTESHRMRAPQPGHSSTSMAKTRRKSSAQPNWRDREEKPSLASVVEARGRDSIDGTLRRAAGSPSSGIFNKTSDAGPVPVCKLGSNKQVRVGFTRPPQASNRDFKERPYSDVVPEPSLYALFSWEQGFSLSLIHI